MGNRKLAGSLMALAAIASGILAAPASANDVDAAVQIRKLDMMLMATSLRCRFGADNFQADYVELRQNQQQSFSLASRTVLGNLTNRMGRKNAIATYDRMSTSMANEFGLGHPWMNCAALKAQTKALAQTRDYASLDRAAQELLAREPSTRLALAR